jgi:hypothetical protein
MLRCTRARRLEVEKYENFLVNHVALLKVEATREIGQSQGQLCTQVAFPLAICLITDRALLILACHWNPFRRF